MKDCVMLHIQKNFKNGADVAATLKDETLKDPVSLPMRKTVKVPEIKDLSNRVKFQLQLEQDGCNLECANALNTHEQRMTAHHSNIQKAFMLILDHCNPTMQNHLTEMPDYETRICDNPIEALKEIKTKMCDPT